MANRALRGDLPTTSGMGIGRWPSETNMRMLRPGLMFVPGEGI
jgi:hypothetical protein